MRRLVVTCREGLCNRLWILLSALALAEAGGRVPVVYWPLTKACAAPWAELFANDWPVYEISAAELEQFPWQQTWRGLPDVLTLAQDEVFLEAVDWLIKPRLYPAHAPLRARCEELCHALRPAPELLARANDFQTQSFCPQNIGVHIRRGDMALDRPNIAGNLPEIMAAVDKFLESAPQAGIFLATDDGAPHPATRKRRQENIKSRFRARYGARVVWTEPRSLDRSTPVAVQDALVDWWLLRQTDFLVGTYTSAFSEMAAYGRDVPVVWCRGGTPAYRRLERLSQRAGTDYWLRLFTHWWCNPREMWPEIQVKARNRWRRLTGCKT